MIQKERAIGTNRDGDEDEDDLVDDMDDETLSTSTLPPPASDSAVAVSIASGVAGGPSAAVGYPGAVEEGQGWAGVSTLKTNYHKVGPGQPVLLVEQYCQPVCCSRRVFLSILHVRIVRRRRRYRY